MSSLESCVLINSKLDLHLAQIQDVGGAHKTSLIEDKAQGGCGHGLDSSIFPATNAVMNSKRSIRQKFDLIRSSNQIK